MLILVSGRQMEVTDALKTAVEKALGSIHNHGLSLTKAEAVLEVNNLDHIIKVTLHGNHANMEAVAKSNNMYHSIHEVTGKLNKQLEKRNAHLGGN